MNINLPKDIKGEKHNEKTLTILIALTMLLSVSACGNSESQQPTDSVISSSQVPQTEGSSETVAQSSSTKLSGTYKVPLRNIYVDTPNYQTIEEAYTELFIIHDSRYVAFTSARLSKADSAKMLTKLPLKNLYPICRIMRAE